MKGIVFTLDAFFALAVAVMSISLLLYFHYAMQTPTSIGYSEVSSLLNVLSSTSINNMTSSGILMEMEQSMLGSNEAWPQPMKDSAHSGSNEHGPLYPTLSFIFPVNSTITSAPVAEYGYIYFVAGGVIYAVNGTTGRLLWSHNVIKEASSIALYKDILIYANITAIGALNAFNGSKLWSDTLPQATSPLLIKDNKVIFGASNGYLYVLYANNGTQAWSNYTKSPPIAVVDISSQVAARLASGSVVVFDNIGNVSRQIVNITLLSSSTYMTSVGDRLFLGNMSNGVAYYINGTKSGTFLNCKNPTGVAANGDNVVFQCYKTLIGINTNSSVSKWATFAPSDFIPLANATPAFAGNIVYTLWYNNSGTDLLATNYTNGATEWQTIIPEVMRPVYPVMAVAYGHLYVAAGSYLLAYGSAPLASDNLLYAVATLYANGFNGWGTAILNSLQKTTSYALEIKGKLSPFTSIASFNSKDSYIAVMNNYPVSPSQSLTISFWVNFNGLTGNYQFPIDSCPASVWRVGINSAGDYYFDPGVHSNIQLSTVVPTKSWQFMVTTMNDSKGNITYAAYLNGAEVGHGKVSGSINPVNCIIIGDGSGNPSGAFYPVKGSIADVQIYNSTLSQSQVIALYQEGMQAPPLSNSKIVSWWPLSGDTNDYASLVDTGYPINVYYTNSNYTPASFSSAYQVSAANTELPIINYTTGNTMLNSVGVVSWR